MLIFVHYHNDVNVAHDISAETMMAILLVEWQKSKQYNYA